jgi:phage replication O-like protein O
MYYREQNNQQAEIAPTKDREEGPYSMLVHEIPEVLMRLDLTAREHKICWFLIREILGYQLKEKIIKTEKFIQSTGLYKQHLNTTIHSLIEKGVIIREEIIDGQPGEYLYSFNLRLFGRINATKEVKQSYVENGKVIHISKYKSPNRLPASHQVGDHGVIESVTPLSPKPLIGAPRRGFKEILNKDKDILKGGVGDLFSFNRSEPEALDLEKRRQHLLLQARMIQKEDEERLSI